MTDATQPPLSPNAPSKARQVATFLDLIKFAHSVFALPFALIATFWAFRASGIRPFSGEAMALLGLILACMVLARTFAMTFNRLIDRKFDAANPRTARRPSVTGAVSVPFMISTLVVCAILFAAATAGFLVFFHNPWPLCLSLPVLAWLGSYSLTKRFTALCHFWLGMSLGLAPLSAWIAVGGSPLDSRGLTILLLGAGVMFWVAGFDILYALQDEAFDRGEHLHSIPTRFGRRKALWISRCCHAMTIAAFVAVGMTGGFHWLYWIGLAFAAALLVIEQSLVSERDISKINIAFMTANGIIGVVFGLLVIADTLIL